MQPSVCMSRHTIHVGHAILMLNMPLSFTTDSFCLMVYIYGGSVIHVAANFTILALSDHIAPAYIMDNKHRA